MCRHGLEKTLVLNTLLKAIRHGSKVHAILVFFWWVIYINRFDLANKDLMSLASLAQSVFLQLKFVI